MAPTLCEVIEGFMARCIEKGLEPATIKSYRYFSDSFLVPELGHVPVDELRIAHFNDLYRDMGQFYVPSTIRKLHTLAGSVLLYAERNELLDRNVARLAEPPKMIRPVRDIPSAQQMRAWLDHLRGIDPLLHDYGYVMANTGMRPGEACAIRQDSLDDLGTLTISHAIDISGGYARIKTTKTRKIRRIVLDPQTIEVIRRNASPFVFGGDEGARSDLLSKRWKRLREKTDTTFTPRMCRHFHATQLILAGHTSKDVADRLGHANSLITEDVYIDYIAARDSHLAASISNVFRPVVAA